MDESGPGLDCALGSSIPLLLIQDVHRDKGVTVEVELEGAGDVRAVWDGGTSAEVSGEGAIRLALPCENIFDDGVGIRELDIEWQVCEDGDRWQVIGTTSHRCYLVLSKASDPWNISSEDVDDGDQVWTDVLDIACKWAAGATDLSQVAARITDALNASGRFVYDTENGASNYTTSLDYFECTEFIDRVNGGEGFGEKLNCTDCATIVSTLSNALGASLVQSQLMYKFQVNPILAIGTSEWKPPFDGRFSYHEVAWEGSVDKDGAIYDACLHFDQNLYAETDEIAKILPAGIRFGEGEFHLYRLLLAVNAEDGYPLCLPEKRTTMVRKLD